MNEPKETTVNRMMEGLAESKNVEPKKVMKAFNAGNHKPLAALIMAHHLEDLKQHRQQEGRQEELEAINRCLKLLKNFLNSSYNEEDDTI